MITKINYMGKQIQVSQKYDNNKARIYLLASSIESFNVDGAEYETIDQKIDYLSQLPHHIFDKLENNMYELQNDAMRLERFYHNVRLGG